ncbi:MAG TPA: protein kinase [Acidimicrobiales bacterium]|nr:protein kinase [Acidimicrobiales bacterium]
MPDPQSLLDRVLVGRYRAVRLIARGGMAEVWEGYDDVLARPVAIKVLHPHLAADEAFVERFRREAIAAARLAHPSIVATFDTGTDGDVTFIVMELVRGRTLRDAIKEAGTLPPAVAVPIAAEVADALEHAHQAGLVHRDVKPANILLSEHQGETAPLLRVKVADFGIAKLAVPPDTAGADLTQTGAVVGTARYLSPEQVQGQTPDARSDVYALGVVLYEMLCGRPPFQAETELATAVLHVRQAPPGLRSVARQVPEDLEAVVLQALAKDPGARFQSAAALRRALLSVDLDTPAARAGAEDDAVPQVVRDPTPPAGVPVVPREPTPSRAPAVVVAVLVVVAAAVVAFVARDGGDGRTGGGGTSEGRGVQIASVRSFDPEGRDGEENEPRAPLAADGNPATAWSTDRYNTRQFGGLKPGVGLVLQLASPTGLGRLAVTSATSDWAASVYVADQPADQLAGWGEPVTSRSGIPGDAEFDLDGREGGAVLLWITDPGPGRQASVSEVSVTAS